MIGIGVYELFPLLLLALLMAFWVWTIIDVLINDFKGSQKILWFILILLFSFPGALVYVLAGRRHRLREKSKGVQKI
ncbi:MAG: PLD nuclease N-terminal domain-containing protein [Thermodesulfobacteriota bacterium]